MNKGIRKTLSLFFYNKLYVVSFKLQNVANVMFDMMFEKVSRNHPITNRMIDIPTPFELLSDLLFECAMFIFDNNYDLMYNEDLEI